MEFKSLLTETCSLWLIKVATDKAGGVDVTPNVTNKSKIATTTGNSYRYHHTMNSGKLILERAMLKNSTSLPWLATCSYIGLLI